MKINSINTYGYSNINNNKQYASKPVFKQSQTDSVSPAILEAKKQEQLYEQN